MTRGTTVHRPARRVLVISALASIVFAGCQRSAPAPRRPSIVWNVGAGRVEVHDLPKRVGDQLSTNETRGREVFAVSTDQPGSVPMLGHYAVMKHITGAQALAFFPRFPLVSGMTYRAEFSTVKFPEIDAISIESRFTVPKPADGTAASVEQVFPLSDRLPQNLLRFYVHFATPMRRGEAYRHITLLNEKGTAIASPFLEISEELWDAAGQ